MTVLSFIVSLRNWALQSNHHLVFKYIAPLYSGQ